MPDEMSETTTREQMIAAIRAVEVRLNDNTKAMRVCIDHAKDVATRLPSPSPCREAHEVTEAEFIAFEKRYAELLHARLASARLQQASEPASAVDWVSRKMQDPEFAAGVARVEAEEATAGEWTREPAEESGWYARRWSDPDRTAKMSLEWYEAGEVYGGHRWTVRIWQLPPPPREPGEES